MIQRLSNRFKAAQEILIIDNSAGKRQETVFSMSKIGAELYTIFCRNIPFTAKEEAEIAVDFGGIRTSLKNYNAQNQPHGLWEYHDKQKLIAHGHYINGRKEGTWVYHTNNVEERTQYADGKRHGFSIHIKRNGDHVKTIISEYEQGEKTGKWRSTSPEGGETGTLVNGEKHGIWTEFGSNYMTKRWAEFSNGEELVNGTSLLELHEYKDIFNTLNRFLSESGIPRMVSPPNLQVMRP
jgi:antitoxin component YwqK of YwqJK toxin-antitoxin module